MEIEVSAFSEEPSFELSAVGDSCMKFRLSKLC